MKDRGIRHLFQPGYCLIWGYLGFLITSALAQVYDLKQMTASEIRNLDRAKTVVMLTIGILEEHGPYLPSFTDGYAAERHTQDIAEAIAEKPGWTVVMFPTIPLGSSAGNEIGGRWHFDGSYTVRSSTLRTILMDLGTELGEGGFRWIFIIYPHGGGGGALNSHTAVDQACDYFYDTYGGHMVNLAKLMVPRPPEVSRNEVKTLQSMRREIMPGTNVGAEEDFCPHCCGSEHSRSLFLHPHLVNPAYKDALPVSFEGRPLRDWAEAQRVAEQDDWSGCFGSFRLGFAAEGAVRFQRQSRRLVELALKLLDGYDYRSIPRYSDVFAERGETDAIDQAAIRYEQEIGRKQRDWLEKRSPTPLP